MSDSANLEFYRQIFQNLDVAVADDPIFTAKGDLVVGLAASSATNLPVGANDTFLVANSAQPTGLKWTTPTDARTALGLVIGTNVQAYDADLTTWAGLTPSANAQSLVTAANYAAMRTLLSLVIGTNVQAWDTELDSLAGLGIALGDLVYGSGANTYSKRAGNTTATRQFLSSTGSGGLATAPAWNALVAGDIPSLSATYQPRDADLDIWATLTPSANAQSLVTAANYAAMRTLLNLVIGTDVQAFDADLTTWAGLTPSANAQSLVTAANYAAMRTLLNLVPGTDIQAFDADLSTIAGLTATTDNFIVSVASAWASRTPAQVRSTLALVIGTNVQAWDTELDSIAGLGVAVGDTIYGSGANTYSKLAGNTTVTRKFMSSTGVAGVATAPAWNALVAGDIPDLSATYQPKDADLTTWAGLTPSANAQSLVTAADYAAMRVLLGLVIGTNVQAYDADLTTWAGLTPSANAQSLVTAADYAAMRTLLGLVIGTNVQAFDADLSTIAGLTATTDNFIVSVASAWASRTPAQVRTTLALVVGTNVQAWDTELDSIAGLGVAQGDIIYGSAANTYSKLAKNTTTQRVLTNGGTSNNPAWGQVDLTTGITGILPFANGGNPTAAWTAWTPTITSVLGSITSYTIIEAFYQQLGKTVFFRLGFNITNAGTSSDGNEFTLPVTAIWTTPASGSFSGIELGLTAKAMACFLISNTKIRVRFYDATFAGATGAKIWVNGVYEAP